MTTVPQNPELIKNLIAILRDYRCIFRQQRVYQRAMSLVLGEVLVFSRHTVTQLLMGLGMSGQDWSGWYRLFSRQRFNYEAASEVLFAQSLTHVSAEEVYVVAEDATQTPRSSGRMEGAGWLRHLRTPAFKVGIHRAQQWFHGSWLVPAEQGYSRALPLRWMPAFTEKSRRAVEAACKEWETSVAFLHWLREHFVACGRPEQRVLFVGDGHYDTIPCLCGKCSRLGSSSWRAVPRIGCYITYPKRVKAGDVAVSMGNAPLHPNRCGRNVTAGSAWNSPCGGKYATCRSKSAVPCSAVALPTAHSC